MGCGAEHEAVVTGVTNDYLVKTNDRLALLYNGQSL